MTILLTAPASGSGSGGSGSTNAFLLLAPPSTSPPIPSGHVALFVLAATDETEGPKPYGRANVYGFARQPDTVEDEADPSAHGIALVKGVVLRDNFPWYGESSYANITPQVWAKLTVITRNQHG